MAKEKIFPVYSSQEVLNFTYDCAFLTMHLEGVMIECGVASGSQLAMMAQCLHDNNINKLVYGFDSFCGIPYATSEDVTQPGIGEININKLGVLETTGISSHDEDNVRINFSKFETPMTNVRLVKGWFQDTVPSFEVEKIALLRLDGDLYESTDVCMKYFFPKLVKGGILIIDDWQLEGCKKAVLKYIDRKDIVEHLGIAYYEKK
jgi:O-methyltransferase